MGRKKWIVNKIPKDVAVRLSESGAFSGLLSVLLAGRGFTSAEEALEFLDGPWETVDPFAFADMDRAVARIERAVEQFEHITVYGDYDADGVTATALLYSYFDARDCAVDYYVPHREEGYGLHREAIDRLKERGTSLIVTVDNGIAALDEIAYAASLGIDVVVTDHHMPGDTLPAACAVVDPHRADCPSEFKDFAGVGVAFQLVRALEGDNDDALFEEYADLVCIGTIGDVVPLYGANRELVRRGSLLLENSNRCGVIALIDVAGVNQRRMTGTTVSFSLVPRINAAGRMGSPERAVRLLLTEDPDEAERLAREIDGENRLRQQMEQEIFAQAIAQLEEEPAFQFDRVLVLAGEGWHKGVTGIVASRMVERFGRPCIMISTDGDEGKGSGRSIEGFSLYEALKGCAGELAQFGGHTLAAGLQIKTDRIGAFRRAINDFAAENCPEMPFLQLKLDCRLNPASIDTEAVRELARMEPFGCGNPAPLFGLFRMKIEKLQPIGGGKHLRLLLRRDNASVAAVYFGMTEENFPYRVGETVDLAVKLDAAEFRGVQSVSIIVQDIRLTAFAQEESLSGVRLYERLRRGEPLSGEQAQAILPSREELASVFRTVRSSGGFCGKVDTLACRAAVDSGKTLVALDAFTEAGIMKGKCGGEEAELSLCPVQGKADLTKTSVLMRLSAER